MKEKKEKINPAERMHIGLETKIKAETEKAWNLTVEQI